MDPVEGVLLDIDGVLVVSWEAVPGAAAALAALRAADRPLRLVTNTTSASRAEVVRRLRAAGLEVATEEVLTAPLATAAWIGRHRPDARCFLVNHGELADDLDAVRLVGTDEAADVVLLGGAGPEFSYDQMNHALGLLLEGAELVAMHQNRYWRTVEGFSLDTGAYLAALEHAAEVGSTVVGKPAPEFFQTAVDQLATSADRVLMVGDDVENDVLGAQAAGVRGVLVRTGKYRAEAVEAADGEPFATIDSIAALPALLGIDAPNR